MLDTFALGRETLCPVKSIHGAVKTLVGSAQIGGH